jgi:chromate transport protein ChrA
MTIICLFAALLNIQQQQQQHYKYTEKLTYLLLFFINYSNLKFSIPSFLVLLLLILIKKIYLKLTKNEREENSELFLSNIFVGIINTLKCEFLQ